MRTRVGYTGGTKKNPTYHDLGDHSEGIQIDYDPNKISYKELLDIFWENHSPEFRPWSRQYMAIIFYHNDEQKNRALESKRKVEGKIDKKIYTEIQPAKVFYLAEAYHQKYYLQLAKEIYKDFRNIYPDFKSFIDSTSVARVNGYIKGYGTKKSLEKDIKKLGLSEKSVKRLIQIVESYGR